MKDDSHLPVTVLMSVFNSERFLKKAIDSILNQSFRSFEFIIIDDGSTDDSLKILESYKDPRIRIIRNDVNIGLTKSLNKGLKLALGTYIARMDADDVSLPERLNKQIGFMDNNPDVGVLGTAVYIIDESGTSMAKSRKPLTHPCCVWNLLFRNSFYHPTVMMRKDLLLSVDGYSENHKTGQDRELWIRVFDKAKLANLEEPLLFHRKHKKQISHELDDIEYKERIESRRRVFSFLLGQEVNYDTLEIMSVRRKLKRQESGLFLRNLNLLYRRFHDRFTLSSSESIWVLEDYRRLLLRAFRAGTAKTRINVVVTLIYAMVLSSYATMKRASQ